MRGKVSIFVKIDKYVYNITNNYCNDFCMGI